MLDPIGLAMENFNALGLYRDKEFNQPIDASGTLITGEEFKGKMKNAVGRARSALKKNTR